MSDEPIRSVLHDRHVALGAKFTQFGGWEMPLEYGDGLIAEHTAVRHAVGLFDVSHLGTVTVRGRRAVAALDRILTNDLSRIGPGRAQYTMLCADDGGVLDDLICYVRSEDDALLIPNAANTAHDVEVLAAALPEGVEIADVQRRYAILAVQGPSADNVLHALGLPVAMRYMSFVVVVRHGVEISVCRTGYTGERGYELVVPAQVAGLVWDEILRAGRPHGLVPAGLGARDTLRTEMGYALHGHEITPDINPVEAGLSWAVGWNKPEFCGARALREVRRTGPARRAHGLLALGGGIPRPGMTVLDADGSAIGTVTSGTFSPTLRKGIALALLRPDIAPGAEVSVQLARRAERFLVVNPPFVPSGVREG